jgi:hypothetical protein
VYSLKEYLRGLGLTSGEAKVWVSRVKNEKSVPIPNVMMPLRALGQYGYGNS